MAKPMASDVCPSGTITAPGSTHPRKQISASERYYRTRRSAFRILERLKDTREEDLTEEQSDSKAWAEAFITEHREKAKMDSAQGKRKRSSEGTSAEAKRTKVSATQMTKVTPKRSFAEVAKGSHVRAVIDRSSHDGAISQANWDLINRSLWKVYRDILKENPGPPPSCSDAGWFQSRVKLMDLYTLAINRIGEPWPGARLDVVRREDIPNRPRSRAWIPDFHSDPEEVLDLIKLGNPELPTSDWKVAKIGEVDGKRRLAVIILNEESLDPLANRKWKINYGFQTLTLHVYRQDVASKSTSAENITSSAEVNEVVTDNDGVASNSGMVGELFERVTLEDMEWEYSDLSAMEDEESLPPISDEENADQTVVGCPSITYNSDGEDCTNQSPPQ
ncbi:uncharacterized protein LOC128862517 [Anastrepha ludens]|uniref:uncharacterized protein LOC128862517 n=1 Tax=Anastrepha ludens TaxID=28586 RepID=UPI0023AEE5E8|nr:uncharacterized protein LOC128862517 [Anastrepha ludens]XP_053957168.1 uncharacterized protein LOC128862517 [Anastrepha ludens]XP_053957169.1 uncharacterized protein LOC128862517 [Anastrepha ludens]